MTPVPLEARMPDGATVQLRLAEGADPWAGLVWIPALGVPARAYDTFAAGLAGAGIRVLVHEWRGIASSSVRASRTGDWGYAQLLGEDIAATHALARERLQGLPCVWGGHSLGGQFAALALAVSPQRGDGLALVASGTPHWPLQRKRVAIALLGAMLLVPAITVALGHLPGRRIGFGGRESRGVMRDWLRCARTGAYRPDGMPGDLEQMLGRLRVPTLGVSLAEDRFAPASALDGLLRKTACEDATRVELDAAALGVSADHFAWMQAPDAVVDRLAGWMRSRFSAQPPAVDPGP